ncbi:MAG: helix-turn-helix domain-containing protein [Actinobacteria bacterium]|nr:helix-turn-helix domain-containing protein [Actinomycetota bacterium]
MRALVLAFTRAAASGAQSLLVSSDKLGHELTSQEVADVLNVSRPHVIKLARTGTLPFRKVGNRHRFRRADIVAYQRLEARRRGEVLARMVPDAGYVDGDF